MINFRWGQAAGQASGFNLAGTQSILRGLRKDVGLGEGRKKEGVQECDNVGPENAHTPLFHSPPRPHPPNLTELSG